MSQFTDPLTALAGCLLLACAAWGVLLLAALACEAGTGGRVRALTWVGCPPALRRALFLALGATLVCEVPAATAQDTDQTRGAPAESGVVTSIAAPGRATGRPESSPTARSAPPGEVVVQPGDSLWSIASASQRGTSPSSSAPTAARVVRLVQQVHHANRSVIGADPDHIEPGQHLRVPWATSRSTPRPVPQLSRHLSKEQP